LYVNARHGVNAPSAKKKDLSGLDSELVNGRFRTSGRRDAQDLTLSAKKHGVAVHALCAMSNHDHLIVTDTGGVLPDFMLPGLPAKQRAAFTVAIYAGMRAGEIWGLHWEDVDFERREIVIRYSFKGPTKGGRIRQVPMLPPVLQELERWRRRDNATRAAGLVFHARDGSAHTKGYDAQWAKTWRSAAGIQPGVRFHDFRHTCASHLIMGTWGRAWRLEEVQVVLGHASRTTTERYARLAPDSIRGVANEAIEQWSDDSKVALGLVNANFAIHASA
jgi:integrase